MLLLVNRYSFQVLWVGLGLRLVVGAGLLWLLSQAAAHPDVSANSMKIEL